MDTHLMTCDFWRLNCLFEIVGVFDIPLTFDEAIMKSKSVTLQEC